jgi:hypothetical protein
MISRTKAYNVKKYNYIQITHVLKKKYETGADWLQVLDVKKDGVHTVFTTSIGEIFIESTSLMYIYEISPQADHIHFIYERDKSIKDREKLYLEMTKTYIHGGDIDEDGYIIPMARPECYLNLSTD